MRRRVPFTVLYGFGLILLGVGCYAGVERWMSTRIVYPLDIPISLAAGHIRTGPFRLNLRADYNVFISIPDSWQWDQAHPECSPYRHLQTRSVLFRDGRIIDRQDEPTTLPWPTSFSATPGRYELDLEALNDFRCLDPIHPHLEIIARTDFYESAAAAIKIAAVVAAYIGLCVALFVPLVGIFGLRAIGVRPVGLGEKRIEIADSPTVSQHFDWAQRLPLRRPISGLPGFGVVGGMIYAIMAMLMMLLTASPMNSKGLWVHLLKPGATPTKSDPVTEPIVAPIIVRLEDAGSGKRPNLYVNSTRVAWEDFDRVLKQRLSIRRDWIVYVEGDDALSWGNVATVIDVANGYHAKVFFVTRK